MFCKNCGTEMNENARFCPKCGSDKSGEQAQTKEIKKDNEIKFQLKPEFNLMYKLTKSIGNVVLYLFLIFLVIPSLFVVLFLLPVTIIIAVVIIAVIIGIKMIFEKKQYDNLEYNFYATKVEYIDGFLNREEKELKYKYIREVTMSQSILERICGIGTIKIFTNASSGMYTGRNHNSLKGKNGIYIHCVRGVQEQYKRIKQIIDEGTAEE